MLPGSRSPSLDREEDASPLKVNRKRKRGAKEVGGTSAPPDAEEVTSKAADAGAVDLTESPPPKGAPQVAVEEIAQAVEQVVHPAEVVSALSLRLFVFFYCSFSVF